MSYGGRALVLLGTASVQRYIFASNRLKENAGASYLAWQATEQWRKDARGGEFLYAGGGNAALVFDSVAEADQAIRSWSRQLLADAPGLRPTAAVVPIRTTLRDSFREAQKRLLLNENAPPFGCDLGALPVTRTCPSTGLAASKRDAVPPREWLSAEAASKRTNAEEAVKRLKRELDLVIGDYALPLEFEHLGVEEGASQIALVHADGNGIGKALLEIVNRPSVDEDFTTELRAFSKDLLEIARHSLRDTVRCLVDALPWLTSNGVVRLARDQESGRQYLPLRPIVHGGDDLTFVCHGRLGLWLTVRYLHHFEEASQRKYSACAGALIMPLKYPFARGYELAEELCVEAKRKRKKAGDDGSWLDFHVLLEGSAGPLKIIREREYRAGDGAELLRRPYKLNDWASVERLWQEFRDRGRWPRSRAKRLFEVLARGKAATKAFLEALTGVQLPDCGDAEARNSGWPAVGPTPYFDPLEILDFHVIPGVNSDGQGGN
jgi:hypothetical protein